MKYLNNYHQNLNIVYLLFFYYKLISLTLKIFNLAIVFIISLKVYDKTNTTTMNTANK